MRFSRLRLPRCGAFSFDRGTLANTRRWLCAACWRLERSTGTCLSRSHIFPATARRAFTSRKVHMGDILLWAAAGPLLSSQRLQYLQSDRERFSTMAFPLGMRWAIGMSLDTRELYSSPNGDRWYLARDPGSGQVFVMHEPNAPSGGRTTCIEIGDFLRRGSHGPEHRELLRLIGTLVESTPQI
jgi:hypothetical protein